jgi:hypothetical protein
MTVVDWRRLFSDPSIAVKNLAWLAQHEERRVLTPRPYRTRFRGCGGSVELSIIRDVFCCHVTRAQNTDREKEEFLPW